jgi:hypothetical protein
LYLRRELGANAAGFSAGLAGSGVSHALGEAEPVRAMPILSDSAGRGWRDVALLRVEAGLDPLRGRCDFKLFVMDLGIPADPFVR